MTAADPRLADIFNRVADELTAIHGPARVRADEPLARFGPHPSMGAAWVVNNSNNGFKLYGRARQGVEISTWSHTGDFASARVQVRSWDAVEPTLRAVLPPALASTDRAVETSPPDLSPARVADMTPSATHPAAVPPTAAIGPSTSADCLPGSPAADVGGHLPDTAEVGTC